MSRTLDQVLADVTAQSDPQRQTILSQIADLPNQQAAQTSAIGAQKDQANQDILDGARQRGLGFSGIPLGEQAKYAATTYAPALANLGTSFNNQKGTLQSALSQIGQNDYTTANNIFNQDRTFEEQQRQFNEQQALARQQAVAQQSSLASLYGGNGNPAPAPKPNAPDPYAKIDKNGAQVSVAALLKTNDLARINQEYNAIKKSAGYGNIFDQYKLGLIESAMKPSNTSAYNPTTANLIKNALNYKPPKAAPAAPASSWPSWTSPNLGGWFN